MNKIENNDLHLEKILTDIHIKKKNLSNLIKKAQITAKNNNYLEDVLTDLTLIIPYNHTHTQNTIIALNNLLNYLTNLLHSTEQNKQNKQNKNDIKN